MVLVSSKGKLVTSGRLLVRSHPIRGYRSLAAVLALAMAAGGALLANQPAATGRLIAGTPTTDPVTTGSIRPAAEPSGYGIDEVAHPAYRAEPDSGYGFGR